MMSSRAFDSGIEAYERYSTLISQSNLPFVRASDGTRVVESATNWTAGAAYHHSQASCLHAWLKCFYKKGFTYASSGIFVLPPPLLISEAGNVSLSHVL